MMKNQSPRRTHLVAARWHVLIWREWFFSLGLDFPGTKRICSSYSVIVRVKVFLKRTVVGDWRFDNLSGSHLQSLPMERASTLFFNQPRQVSHCSCWPNHARSVRVHTPKTQTAQTMWLRCQSTMGMWVGHWSQNQSRPTTISQHLRNNRYTATQRCLLRR